MLSADTASLSIGVALVCVCEGDAVDIAKQKAAHNTNLQLEIVGCVHGDPIETLGERIRLLEHLSDPTHKCGQTSGGRVKTHRSLRRG